MAGSLSLRVQQLDVRCETKTKDNVRDLVTWNALPALPRHHATAASPLVCCECLQQRAQGVGLNVSQCQTCLSMLRRCL